MDKHLNNGYKMAYQKVFKLKKLRKQMSTNTAMLVYKQTILPYFEYCDFLIDACSKREQDKIEKLQYRALRIIHKIRNPREVRRVDLLQLSGMKELRIRRKCHLLNQMHDWKKRGKWLKKKKIGQPEINVYNNFIYLNQRQKKQKNHIIIEEQNCG